MRQNYRQAFGDSRIAAPKCQLPAPEELRAYGPEIVLHMIAMGQHDAEAARIAFVEIARRVVVLSSGGVYRAYGIFKGIEEGPLEPMPLRESSPLRSRLYPYRTRETSSTDLEYDYDKGLAEQSIAADVRLPATILRLPKLYGPGDNADNCRTVAKPSGLAGRADPGAIRQFCAGHRLRHECDPSGAGFPRRHFRTRCDAGRRRR